MLELVIYKAEQLNQFSASFVLKIKLKTNKLGQQQSQDPISSAFWFGV